LISFCIYIANCEEIIQVTALTTFSVAKVKKSPNTVLEPTYLRFRFDRRDYKYLRNHFPKKVTTFAMISKRSKALIRAMEILQKDGTIFPNFGW